MVKAVEGLQAFIARCIAIIHGLPAHLQAALNLRLLKSSAILGALVIALRVVLSRSRSKYRRDGSEGSARSEYDIVIVGGGTAGCVLASRLSENPKLRVLLIEAGGSSVHNPLSCVPGLYYKFFHTGFDWDLSTEPQDHAASKRKYWPRGRMLGGCSSMNAMIFHHGAPSDFDEWAAMQKGQEGAAGWKYDTFNEYFRKFEKFHPSKDYSLVDTTLRGSAGPVHVGYFGNESDTTRVFLEACHHAGLEHNPDFNTAKGTLGSSKVLTFIDSRARRVTTESAYLSPEVLARPNLVIATHAQVTRILFETAEGKAPRAVGVQFKNRKGDMFEVRAKKEVVLSAGATHTPQILMLSGIGPAEHLASFDIPVLVDHPGVGAHLMDHPVIDFVFRDKTKSTMASMSHDPARHGKFSLASTAKALLWFAQYRLWATGPLTTNVAEAAAFARSSDASLLAKAGVTLPTADDLEDSTSGPTAPDIEIFFTPMGYLSHGQVDFPQGHYFGVHAVLLRPTSTGDVKLRSADPSASPIVDPKYLATRHDVTVLVRAARIIGHIANSPSFSSILDPSGSSDSTGLLNHNIAQQSDAEIEKIIRDRVETLYHPTCTARMAPKEDGGVVDPLLRVHGIDGLRVCDASVFPTITSGHTVSPTIALAERAADIILVSCKE
ncbi:GMC oxidoreductase [Daedalea quercina L-15889]|uniref:GMC oxidoreductase n=1 Tax=Daedalea quercina L-15889 TaxID=1314783 RepID=A0A165PAS4_9APHY|nr:GMC oxidoreductase [Daedalea quercina L-15889]